MTFHDFADLTTALRQIFDYAGFSVFLGVFCLGAARLGWWCGGEHW